MTPASDERLFCKPGQQENVPAFLDTNGLVQNMLGITCPAASENGGVRKLANALRSSYDILAAAQASPETHSILS